jgi:hypothetical protein
MQVEAPATAGARSTKASPLAAFVLLVLCSRNATAQDGPYCEKVRARAAGDAALLMSPRLFVQGIKFPSNGQLDVGITAGSGYQVRTGLSFSPLDFYRGLDTLRVADTDCEQHATASAIQVLVIKGSLKARLSGLRAQTAYLTAHREEWRQLSDKAVTRLSERVITLTEFDSLRQDVAALEHKLVQAEGDANQLASISSRLPEEPPSTLARQYVERAMRFEEAQSDLRKLEAWQIQLTGGVVPIAPVDWYGVAEVSFNFGGLARSRQERRYLEARGDELRHASYEPESQLSEFRAQATAALDEARHDLAIVERDVAVFASTRGILEKSEAASVAQTLDTLTVQQIATEADGVYLRADITELASLLGESNGK